MTDDYQRGKDVGEKIGIRKVVDWVKSNRETPLGTDCCGYYVWEGALKAKLEEWGVK